MSEQYLPSNDAQYAAWLTNFHTVAAANATELGLGTGDLLAIQTSLTNINAAIANDTAARAASKAATQTKKETRRGSNDIVRGYARSIQADSDVSDGLRTALGLPVHKQPAGPVTPVQPAALVATPVATGVNILKWKHGGNAPGAVYVVEASTPGVGAWTLVGVSTKTRFDHEGVTPGQPLMYRVWAQRGDMQSVASNQAIVYGG